MLKKLLPFTALTMGLVLLGAGCFGGSDQNNNGSAGGITPSTETPGNTGTTTVTTTPPTTTTTSTTVTTTGGAIPKRRVINMTAKQFAFNPARIEVNQGDTVEIHLVSQDVTHGFQIPEYNVNVKVSEGQPNIITFVATKKGTFTYKCSVPCGPGHLNMKGTLIVK